MKFLGRPEGGRLKGERLAKGAMLAAALGALLTSCWQPPFDPALSASEATVEKLGDPVLEAKVRTGSEDSGSYYLPSRDPDYRHFGYLVHKEDSGFAAHSLYYYDATNYILDSSTAYLSEGDGIGKLVMTPLFPALSTTLTLFFALDSGTGVGKLDGLSFGANYWLNADTVGFGSAPLDGTYDRLFSCSWAPADTTPTIYSLDLAGTESLASPTVSTDTPTDAPAQHFDDGCFVAISPATGYLYLSGKVAGIDRSYRWVAPSGNVWELLSGVTERLTGVLADGRLLADTGDELIVYDADGAFVFSIATGGVLRFVHERYDGAQWISVFTRTIEVPIPNEGDVYQHIEVYEIPSPELASLAR